MQSCAADKQFSLAWVETVTPISDKTLTHNLYVTAETGTLDLQAVLISIDVNQETKEKHTITHCS